jgi:hypothetical protein
METDDRPHRQLSMPVGDIGLDRPQVAWVDSKEEEMGDNN